MKLKVGQRILYTDGLGYNLSEATILEISPSENYIKLKSEISQNVFWLKWTEVCVVEIIEESK